MVIDVAEERHQPIAHRQVRAAHERVERAEQRVHGPVEVRDLAPQLVDPLSGRSRATEHGGLHFLDVAFEALDHGRVVVDDLVQDRPQRRHRPLPQQFRPALEPLARAV
jgi:hypothetical protein